MKALEFETSKGRFVVKDLNFIPLDCNGIKLSEITEEQASEIVDNPFESVCNKTNLMIYIKDKGIHLFKNPYTNSTDLNSSFFSMQTSFKKEKEAEQKTFYNPYIFKICG